MARKKAISQRVELIATKRTQGAQPGAIARPLAKDVEAWLKIGWQRVDGPNADPQHETE